MKTVCFITHSTPNYLGGVSIYHKNLLNYLKDKSLNLTWAYFGKENRTYSFKGINYIEIKKSIFQIPGIINNFKIRKFLSKNYFDVVFCTGGFWTWFYLKHLNQKIIHVFHGTVYHFNKNHFKRFGLFKKILFLPILTLSKLSEYPHYELHKIICVSNKVKKHVKDIYGEDNIDVIRTGVDLNEFKPRTKSLLFTDPNEFNGLYVGGGGWYTKGLDRAIKLSREIHKLNPNYKLIVIGPDENKVKGLLNEEFIIFLKDVPRDQMKYYYNASNIFFCMSRFEGGGPTLTTSEAMSSGCLIISSVDAKQEILRNNYNGLIISNFDKNDAKRILNNIDNKKLIKNSLNTIRKLSLESWGDKFLKIIKKC